MKTLLLLMCAATLSTPLFSYEEAMDRTSKGEIEVKTVPEMTVIEATSEEGTYFDKDNRLFRKLFRYISDKDIAMTTPVTVDVSPGAMRFVVSDTEVEKADEDTTDVKVMSLPERQVVSIGYNGRYNEANYKKHLVKLKAWLEKNETKWKASGEPIAVYWDGPFKLGPWKRAEVMIPVEKVVPKEKAEAKEQD